MSSKRIFSCPECGNKYEAYPPDDHYTSVTLDEDIAKKNASGKIVTIIHDCDSCMKPITLYWYRPKIGFRIVRT